VAKQPLSAGSGSLRRVVNLNGVALPFMDGAVVVASDGSVASLDAVGRRLWEALHAGCTIEELVNAGVEHGGLSAEVARTNLLTTIESWRALGLVDAPGQKKQANEEASGVTPVLGTDPFGYDVTTPHSARLSTLPAGRAESSMRQAHRLKST
jgi:hypothetical protein